ncbi:MAG: hypothetical protein JNL58_19870 [Planctomyces sp.]|nr:hypothetical protein [Planctomyces sp.]
MLFNSGNQNRRRIHKHASRLGKASEHCEIRALLSADAVLAGCDAPSDLVMEPELNEEPEFTETSAVKEPTEFIELLHFPVEWQPGEELGPGPEIEPGEIFELIPIDLEYVAPDGSLPGDILIETATDPDSEIGFEELAGLPYEDSPPEDGWDPSWVYRSLPTELPDDVPGQDTMMVYSDDSIAVEFFELSPESVVDQDDELITGGEVELADMQESEPGLLWMMSMAGEATPSNTEASAPVSASESTNLMPAYPERTPLFNEGSKQQVNPANQQSPLAESYGNPDVVHTPSTPRSTQSTTVRKHGQPLNTSLMSSLSEPLKPLEAGFERPVESQSLLFSSLDNEADDNLSSV